MFAECLKMGLLGFCAGALLGTMVCGARIQPEQILIEELKKLDVKGQINWDKL